MVFEDVFYPGNPQRRRQVYELRGEIISIVRRYKAEWNEIAFVITDVVVSAIMGAIERKELNEAIDALQKLKAKMMPLDESISKMAAINIGIRKGSYQLDDNHFLFRGKNGEWRILDLNELCMTTGRNNSLEDILDKIGDEDGILLIAA